MTSVADMFARKRDRENGVGTNSQAVKFCQQDYEGLRAQCLQARRLFEDSCFPAEGKSLGFNELGPYSSKTRGLVWKRPKELCSNPTFIDDGATRTDICQGALGDCWLLAAIASLTLDQQVLARVVPPEQNFDDSYAGIFHFQFWQFGQWVDVVIDDRLPTKDGKLLFVHSAESSEFWSALLEKAYAKLNGSYEALSGGSTTEGFEDFTGGIAESYELSKAPPFLFKLIQKALGLGSLLGCSIDVSGKYETEAVTSQKLVKGHAYSVTGAEEVHVRGKPVELIRIRNPWGQVEWTGAWSDDSKEWTTIPPEEKSKLCNAAEDGEFWMSYADFIKNFSKVEICNLTPDTLTSDDVAYWNHYQFEGAWRVGSTAGGCRNNQATFCSNPQFLLHLEEVDDVPLHGKAGCTFLVGLMQKDGRKDRRVGKDLNSIGFAIYKFKGRTNIHLGPEVLLRQRAVAMSSTFINLREVCDRFTLPPGDYVIIPSTFEPHINGSFILRVFSEKQAKTGWGKAEKNQTITEDSVDPQFKYLFKQIAGNVSLQIPHLIDGNGTLGLVEFHALWMKIQKYLEIFKAQDSDRSGTMSSHEMREALSKAGFQVNNAVLQVVVNRYANVQYAIDFNSFVDCLIRMEMLFRIFKKLDGDDSGKIHLDMQEVTCVLNGNIITKNYKCT
uniref:Calpain 8 n=1 Tax=Denticeps clupeoides TaxID=299321 RepID=A0AAY4E921_9TELE